MIKVVFKNLDESEIAKDAVLERLEPTLERFPDLMNHKVTVTLSMDNSQFKAGPDLFKVKLLINGKRYKGIILEKSAMSLYWALADVVEHTLERLNRFGDKQRVRSRTLSRKISEQTVLENGELHEENSL